MGRRERKQLIEDVRIRAKDLLRALEGVPDGLYRQTDKADANFLENTYLINLRILREFDINVREFEGTYPYRCRYQKI